MDIPTDNMSQIGPRVTRTDTDTARVGTGIAGLDEVCHGGLPANSAYLIRGGPGCGKTTLTLHFLAQGAAQGETGMFISFGETAARLKSNAPATMDLSDVVFIDLSPTHEAFTEEESYDVFASADVEGEPLLRQVREAIEEHQPTRVVIDSMTHLSYLTPDQHQYRKRVLGLIRHLNHRGATALFTSEATTAVPDDELAFISDGVVSIEKKERIRQLDVAKLRGSDVVDGPHTVVLTGDGMAVYPRVWPGDYAPAFDISTFGAECIGTGLANMDRLLGGGVHRGTITVIAGPTGVGKSSFGIQFMKEAAGRGERSLILSFEEARDTLLQRTRNINIPIESMEANDLLSLVAIEPRTFTVEELFALLRTEVENKGTRVVLLDSLAGFRHAVKGSDDFLHRVHDICRYLGNMGVTVFVIDELEHLSGNNKLTNSGFSYLTDNAIMMRYHDEDGALGRNVMMLKRRTGPFERAPRRFEITSYGLDVGEPMHGLGDMLGRS